MKTVQKGNRQLRVTDDRLEDMLKLGYTEVDGRTGRPVDVPARKDDASELLKAAKSLKKENSDLKKENSDLKAQVKALKAQAESRDTQS